MNRKNRSRTIIALLTLLMTISVIGYSKKTSADGTITEISLQQIQSIEVTTNQSIEIAETIPENETQITKEKKVETPKPTTTPETTTEVSNTPASAPKTATKETWERIAACESTSRWDLNTGNGYYGGLQFSAATWKSAGGTKYAPLAHQASKDQQIEIADAWLAKTSWSQWGCAARLGIS